MLEEAKAVTANGTHTYVEYARYADDLVILVNNDRRQDWLVEAVNQRLREELATLDVRLNEEKSRIVDLVGGRSIRRSRRSARRCCGSSRRCSGAPGPRRWRS